MTISAISSASVRILVILSIFCLNGCFTTTLWDYNSYVSQAPLISVGKPQELSVDQREKKICISYFPSDRSESKEIRYLLIDEGTYLHPRRPSDNLQVLSDIISNDFPFRISSIFARVQHHESIDYFVLVFMGRFNDDIVAFEKEDKYSSANLGKLTSGTDSKLGLVHGEDEVANAIIRQRWQAEFGEMSSPGFVRPIAWIDRNNEVNTTPIDYQRVDEVNGLVMEVRPPVKGIKYINLKLNLRSFSYLSSSSWFLDAPVVPKPYDREPYYLLYGAYQSWRILEGIPTRSVSWLNDSDCRTGNWMPLPMQKVRSFDLYSTTSKVSRAYDYSLPARIVGSPFSAVLDVVTFPVQYGYYLIHKDTMP